MKTLKTKNQNFREKDVNTKKTLILNKIRFKLIKKHSQKLYDKK